MATSHESGSRWVCLVKVDRSVLIALTLLWPGCLGFLRPTYCLDLFMRCSCRACHVLSVLLGCEHQAGRTEKPRAWCLAPWFLWFHGLYHFSPPSLKHLTISFGLGHSSDTEMKKEHSEHFGARLARCMPSSWPVPDVQNTKEKKNQAIALYQKEGGHESGCS